MDKKVHELLNNQINKEFYSAYLYLEFSNYFKAKGLDGFANWYMIQAQEERDHALLFYQYLQNNNMPVTLEAIDSPKREFADNLAVLQAGLSHEEYVTSLIHDIYAAARNWVPVYTQHRLWYCDYLNELQKGEIIMKKYVCEACGWEYDEAKGDPDNGIEPGTKFEDLPEDFECPLCGVGKDMFTEAE